MKRRGYPNSMLKLINELSKLPSIGEKSAARLAYHLVTSENGDSQKLAEAIAIAKDKIGLCETCFSITENNPCDICDDKQRDPNVICVVEKPADVIVLEQSGAFYGTYHVLHGLWSPLRGVGPNEIKLKELFSRVSAEGSNVKEVLIATSTTVEGDATSLYIANELHALGVKATRIAQGMPKGGELEFADVVTLSHAIEGRKVLEE